MDWIHCNICYQQPSKERTFSLTSCGHMYCDDCLKNAAVEGECGICKSKCNCIQLVQDMDPDVKEFFVQPEDMLMKLMNILEFQKKHRMKLTAHWISLNHKYDNAKKEIARLQQVTQKMYSSLKDLHKQNKMLKNSLGSHNNCQVQMTPSFVSPSQVPMYPVSSGGKHQNTPNSKGGFSSRFVTPHRVNKIRNSNGPICTSLYKQQNNVNYSDIGKGQPIKKHAFLTPPDETPPYRSGFLRS